MPETVNAHDEWLAGRKIRPVSYDATKYRDIDPPTVAALNAAEDRKAGTMQLPNPDAEAEAVMRGLGIKPSAAEAAFSQTNAQNDHSAGAKFWERLKDKFQLAEQQPLKNRLEDYSMRTFEYYKNLSGPDGTTALGRDIRRGEGPMQWPDTYTLMGDVLDSFRPSPVMDKCHERDILEHKLDKAARRAPEEVQSVMNRPADRLLSEPLNLTPHAKVAAVVDKLERKYRGHGR